jgi:putative redox protein
MECSVKWLGEGVSFLARTESGHLVAMDGAPAAGGNNLAPRPMELLLAGMGGCSAFDVVTILKKGRHDVRGCTITISADRAETDPKVFTRIHMIFTVTGKGLRRETVERAVGLSKEKYCSASIMLGQTAAISHAVIVEDTEGNC